MKSMHTRVIGFATVALGLVLPAVAVAHSGGAHTSGVMAGLLHPVTGWDHFVAALAVGARAGRRGLRPALALGAGFVAALVVGAAAGLAIAAPLEQGMWVSLAVLGLLIALAANPPVAWSAAAAVAFGAYHGLLHGAEMPGAAAAAGYITGVGLTSLLLTATGCLAGTVLWRQRDKAPGWLLRASGAVLACASLGGLAVA